MGTGSPEQYCSSPPLTGAITTGHEQSGAVIDRLFRQPLPSVTVIVMLVPEVIALTNHIFPLVFTTVPEVLVTVPELTVTPTEYVNKSAAQFAAVVTVIVGKALTVTVLCGAAAEQVVAVMVSVTLTVPAPATFHVTVIELLPAPPVIIPPVTVHT